MVARPLAAHIWDREQHEHYVEPQCKHDPQGMAAALSRNLVPVVEDDDDDAPLPN